MRKDKPQRRKGGDAFSKLPKEKRAQLDQIAANAGMEVPRVGAELDRQFTSKDRADDSPPLTVYQRLADVFGVATLDTIEGGVFFLLGGLLLSFLGSGLLIASEAFFKASKTEISPGLDAVVVSAEQWFTPLLFAFLAVSSLYGLYKQSQLNSGIAQYDEDRSR